MLAMTMPRGEGLESISRVDDLMGAFSVSAVSAIRKAVFSRFPQNCGVPALDRVHMEDMEDESRLTRRDITVRDLADAMKKETTLLWFDSTTAFPMPPKATHAIQFTVDVRESNGDLVLAATLLRIAESLRITSEHMETPRVVDVWYQLDGYNGIGALFFDDALAPVIERIRAECMDSTRLGGERAGFFGGYPITVWNSLMRQSVEGVGGELIEESLGCTW